MLPSLTIDERGEYRAKFFATPEVVGRALAKLEAEAVPNLRLVDGEKDLWACYELINGPLGLYGISANFGTGYDEEPFVEFVGYATLEGEDALDYTRVPTELSLDDLLAIAAVAKTLLAN